MQRNVVALGMAAAVGLVLVVWLVFDVLPDLFTPEPDGDFSIADEQSARGDVRTSALTLLGGLSLAVGAVLTARSVRTARETNEIARAGQVTDRFTKAVEQIGDRESLAVRLGGIYALEQIARDSEGNREPIKQLLGAFVHERAHRVGDPQAPVPVDVQAALTVLGRREPAPVYNGGWLDFKGLQLCEVDLSNARLDGVDLSGADLTLAKMWGVKQTSEPMADGTPATAPPILRGATLHRATMVGANLRGSDLREADLSAAVLGQADLSNAKLVKADLSHAKLRFCTLNNCDLTGADLTDADLSETYGLDFATLDDVKSNDGTSWPGPPWSTIIR